MYGNYWHAKHTRELMHRPLTHATLTGRNDGVPHISQKTRRHHSRAVREALSTRAAPLLTNRRFCACAVFRIKKELAKRRDFIPRFMESSQTSVEQGSKGSSWHPHISHYQTCDSWPPISDSLHFPRWGGGRRRNVRSIKG